MDKQELEDQIITKLQTIFDPEIPVNIFELGLIYTIRIDDDTNVEIDMTLTSPACPVAETLPPEVEMKIRTIQGINDLKVNLVWNPQWDKDMMSEAAKLQLGFL